MKVFVSVFLIIIHINLTAQNRQMFEKAVRICGEYTYHAPDNVSLEQAKNTALERAKIQALAEKFGTTVTQQNLTVITTENEKVDTQFRVYGGSEVKGEWLEDIKPPEYKIFYQNDMLVVFVLVCGNAREIVGAGIDFTTKILKNGTQEKFESSEFRHDDEIYLLFRTPTAGFIAVYLIDGSNTAFCMLPCMNNQTGKVAVAAGREHIFFSKEHATNNEKEFVTQYKITAEKNIEHNSIYVIFSPNEFTKAYDTQILNYSEMINDEILPRQLPFEDFQKWLNKNKARDKDMKVEIKTLTIKK